MMALHAGRPGKPPKMPDGVEVRQVSLPGTREPPRREYFLAGTAQSQISATPHAARPPSITNPVNGHVHAFTPHIPLDTQRHPVTVCCEVAGYRQNLEQNSTGGPHEGTPKQPP